MATKSLLPPRLGKKKVYLPNMIITLLRTPTAPPTFATFKVPLNINKLDLRDYLYNAYGIQVKGVRSFIQQQKAVQVKPGEEQTGRRKLFRPRSIKKMMVEMYEPFVWPEEPKDKTPWDNQRYHAEEAERDEQHYQAYGRNNAAMEPNQYARDTIAEQAKKILSGKDSWEAPKNDYWENDGEAVEVEKDMLIPKN